MTENHPITPPESLLRHWQDVIQHGYSPGRIEDMLTEAFQTGADQELEACISAILDYPGFEHPELFVEVLRAARRPKPPSLKELALQALDCLCVNHTKATTHENTIRRALEQLDD